MVYLTPEEKRALEGITPELADRRDAREEKAQSIRDFQKAEADKRAWDLAKWITDHPEPYEGYDPDD